MELNNLSDDLQGFLLLDKPTGVTSYYCIQKIKQVIRHKTKIGHAGTLDSFATGLLIIGISRSATRNISQIMKLDKWYRATGKLGQLTDTLDFTGSLIQDEEISEITHYKIQTAIHGLGHQYKQIPPIYSALKYKGKTLSDLVRQEKLSEKIVQKIAEKKAKIVTIYSCELISLDLPYFTIEAHVSHGTYIRVLVNTIAQKLGTYATTHELKRTKIGPFAINEAQPLSYFKTIDEIKKQLISIDAMLTRLTHYTPTE
jgi:tRNA pseudouridine55 synthase